MTYKQKYKDGDIMNWERILKEKIEKENSKVLESLDVKQKKALKKTMQAAEPSEYFGQDFTKLGELIDILKDLELIKADKKMNKRLVVMDEANLDIVASAGKLRKDYETLYRQLRGIVYPKRKGDLRDE
jgi:ABC-type phosphate transport system auxiliary subunit